MKNKLFTFFWHGPFSQWHKSKFISNGVEYFWCEQFMMASKARLFKDDITLEKIMKSTSPKEIKDLGREVKNFNQEVWDKYKFNIVMMGNFCKFNQNIGLKNLLLETGNTILVEASPYDKVWGIGLSEESLDALDMNKWMGENLLGKALTSVRDIIRVKEHSDYLYQLGI